MRCQGISGAITGIRLNNLASKVDVTKYQRSEFLEKALEGSINEMRPSVTYYHPRCAKPHKYNLMEHLTGMLSICSSA